MTSDRLSLDRGSGRPLYRQLREALESRPGSIVLDEPSVSSGPGAGHESDEIQALPEFAQVAERVRGAIHQQPTEAVAS